MSIDLLSSWLLSIIKRRSLSPDGRLLFAYDLSQNEYVELRLQLSKAIDAAGGIKTLAEKSLGRSRLAAPPAAFVLYAAEWWKRDYAGGVWDWSPILESLGADPEAFTNTQQLRSDFVARGLAFWQLSPLDKGKRFIGSIVVNGGIPMRLLAQGDGAVAMVLSQALKQAGRYRWGHAQVLEAVSDRLIQLPTAYRRPEIAELLAQFVDVALQLKDECQLEGLADPTTRLDVVLPDWRRRFPISLESQAAQALLTGLVREAAIQGAGGARALFVAERRLFQDPDSGQFTVETHVTYPTRIAAEDLATIFGLNDVEVVPRQFTIDLESETRQPCAEGRLVLGAKDHMAVLVARRMELRARAASCELQLILSSPTGDHGERYTVEGGSALSDEDPWIFVDGDSGYPVMVATGGARLPNQSAWIALPAGWEIECECEPVTVGDLRCPGLLPRRILCVKSDARLMSSGIIYRVRLGQVAQPGQFYQWKAQRLPEARGRAVFRDRQPPRLYRATEDGLQVVKLSDQRWFRPGSMEQLTPKDARGPVEVRIHDEGELVARQRIFILPPEARVEYISGHVIGTGTVRLINWGTSDVAPEVTTGVTAAVSREGSTGVNIDLASVDAPPSEFRVRVRWPGTVSELALVLHYPVTGGRFLRADETVMRANETVTLQELVGMRLQIFDTNPAHPKRYELQLALEQGTLSTRYPIALHPGVGRAEVRLIDHQKQIESLLGLFDELDAKVKVSLVVGGQVGCDVRVGRYTTTLQTEEGCVRVPADTLALIPVKELECTRVLACPLTQPEVNPVELAPVRSQGVHTGAWVAEGMSPVHGPWLVYPAPASGVQFRPLLWLEGSDDELETSTTDSDLAPDAFNLADAMSLEHSALRWGSMHSALRAMSADHKHESWPLLDSLWRTFRHLPLTALDVWRMLAKQPKAILSFLLRSELSEAELAEALQRLHRETGWVPELTTIDDLCEVAQTFWRFWVDQGLEPERCRKYFKEEFETRVQLLANEIPSLGPLIETAVFAATGTITGLLLEVAGPARQPTRELLRALWEGGSSLVNSQLFLVNGGRDVWPRRDFVEQHALPALLKDCPPDKAEKLRPHLERIFWSFHTWRQYFASEFNPRQQPDFKFTVVNLPIVCALWAATSSSRQWWSDPRSRLAFKQIRDFDPIWFEQAYRQAFKVCMSIDGLVQLPPITDL